MIKTLMPLLFFAVFLGCSDVSIPEGVDTSMMIDNQKSRELDIIYQDAIHNDTSRAVFKSQADQEKVVTAFREFMKGLGPFLREHHFKWGEQTTCWNKMYMDTSGTIEYYTYDFKTPVEKEKEEQFRQLAALYIQTHKMPLTAGQKFSQCGTVVFADKNE